MSTPMQDQITSKVCRACGEDKPLTEYHVSPRGKHGRIAQCRTCANARARELSQTSEARARQRRWVEANREKSRAIKRRWQAANPEKHRDGKRAAAEKLKNERPLEYIVHNRFRTRPYRPYTRAEIEYGVILLCDPCAYCGGSAGDIYHIDATSQGGANEWPNMTAACHSCNSRKFRKSLLHALLARVAEPKESK